jgi:hypothetical protein
MDSLRVVFGGMVVVFTLVLASRATASGPLELDSYLSEVRDHRRDK